MGWKEVVAGDYILLFTSEISENRKKGGGGGGGDLMGGIEGWERSDDELSRT